VSNLKFQVHRHRRGKPGFLVAQSVACSQLIPGQISKLFSAPIAESFESLTWNKLTASNTLCYQYPGFAAAMAMHLEF